MAMIRRHWRSLGIQIVLIAVIIGMWIVMPPGELGHARAQGTLNPGVSSPAAEDQADADRSKIDPAIYSQVQQLREDLALTNLDLAAMGCTEAQATRVLSSLLSWTEQNQEVLATSRNAVRDAQRALRETYRTIHIGPRDDAVIRAIPALEQGAAIAEQQRRQLIDTAGPAATTMLTSSQMSTWQAAKTNIQKSPAVPGVYRYVAGLDDQQIQAIYRQASDQSRGKSTRDVIVGAQMQAAQMAMANQQAFMEQVLAAEEAALPVPEEFMDRPALPAAGVPIDISQP